MKGVVVDKIIGFAFSIAIMIGFAIDDDRTSIAFPFDVDLGSDTVFEFHDLADWTVIIDPDGIAATSAIAMPGSTGHLF